MINCADLFLKLAGELVVCKSLVKILIVVLMMMMMIRTMCHQNVN